MGWGDGASTYGALKLLRQGQGREGLSTGSYSVSAMVTASATVPLLPGHLGNESQRMSQQSLWGRQIPRMVRGWEPPSRMQTKESRASGPHRPQMDSVLCCLVQ